MATTRAAWLCSCLGCQTCSSFACYFIGVAVCLPTQCVNLRVAGLARCLPGGTVLRLCTVLVGVANASQGNSILLTNINNFHPIALVGLVGSSYYVGSTIENSCSCADMLPIFKLWSVVRCEPPRADTILVLVDQLNYFMFRYLMFPSSLAKVCGASGSC